MAQPFSAGAKNAESDASAGSAGDDASPPGDADVRRDRAVAYVDLWERHFTFVAAQGAPRAETARGRRDPADRE
jgi:hypothetical protein